jgi:prepilin-type N-terminal cleavage/methylation domain-containing protein
MKDNNSKLNNQGFSLVELLVALAISGIVIVMISLLIVNSSNLFNNENKNIDLQNEFQVVDGFLSETLMEAKTIDIVDNGDGDQTLTLYTGTRGSDEALQPVTTEPIEAATTGAADESIATEPIEAATTGATTASITTERIITFKPDSNSLYITKSKEASLTKGNRISSSVKKFKVSIDDSCKTYKEVEKITHETILEHTGYANPIILNIELNVSNGKSDKTEVVKITVRNQLKKVVVNGKEFTVK